MLIPDDLRAALDEYAQANRDLGYGVSIKDVKAIRNRIDDLIRKLALK
jgi:hypothetical protein